MKKIEIGLIIVLIAFVTGCDGNISTSGDAFSNLTVKDWESYSSFGVGIPNSGSREINSETGYELVGFRADGSIEALKYDDKSGKEVSTTLYVGAFVDYERFAFAVLSLNPYSYVLTNEDLDYIVALGGDYFYGDEYLIDKQSGKFYFLGDKVGTFQINNGRAWEVGGVFYAMDYTAYTGTSGLKVFRINNSLQLEVETRLGEDYSEVRVDRYQNTFYNSNGVTYVLSSENRLNVVPSESGKGLYQGFNGIVYYDSYLGMNHSVSNTQYYNEAGNLVETDFVPQALGVTEAIRFTRPLIHTDIDYIYWYENDIYWVHFTDSEKFQYEVRTFASNTKENITICGSYLVWVNNTIIQTLSLATGVTGSISMVNGSDSVFIEELSRGGDGKIYFSGTDQNRSSIEGVLNNDLTYNFEAIPYSQNSSSIIYISPIN